MLALKPFVSKGRVRGTVARTGCADQARLRVRIKVSAAGPDRVVKSGSKVIGNGRITANVRCGSTPRRYYMVALDSQGRTNTSRAPAAGVRARGLQLPLQRLRLRRRDGRRHAHQPGQGQERLPSPHP